VSDSAEADRLVLDQRLHAYRPNLADARLQGRVEAAAFVEGETAAVGLGALPLLNAPRADAAMDSQLLPGEAVHVFERRDGWAWVQAATDGYVGYVCANGLIPPGPSQTHLISAACTPLLSDARQKGAPVTFLSLGTGVTVVEPGERFHRIDGGYVFADHLRPADRPERDWVAVAQRLLGLPYLWGGRGAGGIDCSGLVQVALAACGIAVLRDSDQQAATVGEVIPLDRTAWQKGDLIFVPGHVMIVADCNKVIHASGHCWSVLVEPLASALSRLESKGVALSAVRRPTLETIAR